LLCTDSRPPGDVPETICAVADLICGWIRERGAQWKALRAERLRLAREAEQRRAAEERAEEARRRAEEEEEEAAVARREEAARMRELLALLEDDEDGAAVSAGNTGGHMDVDEVDVAGQLLGGSAAPAEIAVTASTGGTAADDEGEDEQSTAEHGLVVSAAAKQGEEVTVGTKLVAAAVAGAKDAPGKDSAEDRRTAAERVEFREGIHEVRIPASMRRWGGADAGVDAQPHVLVLHQAQA
jgi:hypothetical protein